MPMRVQWVARCWPARSEPIHEPSYRRSNRPNQEECGQSGALWSIRQKVDSIRVDPVDRDSGRACNHKLKGASHATASPRRRLPTQRLHRVIDSATHVVCECEGAFFLNPGGDVLDIRECVGGQPSSGGFARLLSLQPARTSLST
jgi:hypothetical protein